MKQLAFILVPKTDQNHVLEASWGVRAASWRPLRASWARLGASWAPVGASCRRLGASWSVWSAYGARLQASWPHSNWNYVRIPAHPGGEWRGTQLCLAPGKPNYQDEGNLTKETLHRKTTYREGVYESECMRVSAESESREWEEREREKRGDYASEPGHAAGRLRARC